MNQAEIVACIYKHVGRTADLETLTELSEDIARMATDQERERADYAWRNTNTIEKTRQEEVQRREATEATLKEVRHHLTQLATFADQAVGVLATIEAESTEEEEKLQAIIDGLQRWAPDAMREAITDRHPIPEFLRKNAIGQGSAACGASPAPTGCASKFTTENDA